MIWERFLHIWDKKRIFLKIKGTKNDIVGWLAGFAELEKKDFFKVKKQGSGTSQFRFP